MDLRRSSRYAAGACMLLLVGLGAQPLRAAESFDELLTEGKVGVGLRYRLEFVEQDAFALDAEASTLRGRLNFKTGDWNGWGAFAEFDYVANFIWDDYNGGSGTTPDKTQFPMVSDPTGEDPNQAYLQWAGGPWAGEGSTLLRGGRQRIIYDNARFVGNVGWRQNEQTFDAAYWQQKFGGGYDLQVAYVWQVNRIFGNDVPAGTDDSSTWLGNLSRDWKGIGKLSAYAYDLEDEDVAAFSTQTFGLRFAGTRKLGGSSGAETTLGYGFEYARQAEAHGNPVDYSASYYRIDLSLTLGKIKPYVACESLGGDAARTGAYFRTPLATLHAFNGWADKFLTTPDAGLVDLIAGVTGPVGTWTWDVIYHDFDSESGSQSLGREIDASLGRGFAKHYGVLFKAAWFNGEPGTPYGDTTKLWAQFTADF